jgi:hypothetical protein
MGPQNSPQNKNKKGFSSVHHFGYILLLQMHGSSASSSHAKGFNSVP